MSIVEFDVATFDARAIMHSQRTVATFAYMPNNRNRLDSARLKACQSCKTVQ
jgi:hypothetical protein